MGFIAFDCRFPEHVSEATWRAAMVAEVGPKLARPIEWSTSDGVPIQVGDVVFPVRPAGVTTLGTGDVITTEYAIKVSLALGGQLVQRDGSSFAKRWTPAPWATTPWIAKSRWQRLKVRTELALQTIRELQRSKGPPKARVHQER